MNRRLGILGIIVLVVGFVLADGLFVVNERQQALVLQFGAPVRVIQEPGLNLKIPFFQNVVYYEDRVLAVDPPPEQVILADQRRLDVDAFARYRIIDPLQFFQAVNNEVRAVQRLSTFINASLRRVLGNVTQVEILSEERAGIMRRIRSEVTAQSLPLGIEIVDVRIGRADVPADTVQSVYDRMRSEREREAAEFRAQGFEQAQQIRSRADRERTVIIAEAERDAQFERGEGDREAIKLMAEAFDQDREFFSLYRSLQAYRNSLGDDDTTLVLSPESDFFQYFDPSEGVGQAGGAGGGQ
ncbi:MAG: protease modulator HflC [Pseudomonadota bacterium]